MHPSLDSTTLAMFLADARLPVGGNINSAGLEPALAHGLPAVAVSRFMAARASTIGLVEAGTAVVARHRVLSTIDRPDSASDVVDRLASGLADIEVEWAARTPSGAVRDMSRSLGRGYLRLARRLWPAHSGIAACSALPRPASRALVLGVVAAAAGLEAASLVRLVFYDDAQSVASALLKLEPLDPLEPTAWVLETCMAVEHLVPALALLTSPSAIPAAGAPQIEEWAEAHASATQRLFRA